MVYRLSLLAIFNTLFWVYAKFLYENGRRRLLSAQSINTEREHSSLAKGTFSEVEVGCHWEFLLFASSHIKLSFHLKGIVLVTRRRSRFETEMKGNPEMGYFLLPVFIAPVGGLPYCRRKVWSSYLFRAEGLIFKLRIWVSFQSVQWLAHTT